MLSVLFFLAVSSAPVGVIIKPTDTGFVATAELFDAREQPQVDAEIERRAADLCAGRAVRWGEFNSNIKTGKAPSAEPAPVSEFSRAFSCAKPSERTFAAAPADWQPNAQDEADVRQVFERYYTRRDGGDFLAAKGMFAPEAIAGNSKWPEQMAEFNKVVGAGTRRISGITWYINPEDAPHPGAYVAVDFVGDFKRSHFYCGYIVLFRTSAGSYEIVREEQNHFDRNDQPVDASQLAQMRATMCRGG
jgi:hypothetical protein